MLVMRNEFVDVIKKFNKLPPKSQKRIIKKVTKKHATPTIEGYIKDLCIIENMGRVTATEVMFKIGIKLQLRPFHGGNNDAIQST